MQIKNITMSFGAQVLFENVNLNISKNEKGSVVGVNRAWKTTYYFGFIENNSASDLQIPRALSFEVKKTI